MWHSRMGWSVGQLCLAWEAVPSTSQLTCKSYGNSCTSSLLCVFSLSLSLCPFLSFGCYHLASVQRNISTSNSSSNSRKRCKEPRGAPMAPHSHLLFPSLSIISRTPTPIPFPFLSLCLCPSPHAGPQNTRIRQSGGRRFPVITSQRQLWTCVHGAHRMKVKSPYLKTGRWPTQRQAWCTS